MLCATTMAFQLLADHFVVFAHAHVLVAMDRSAPEVLLTHDHNRGHNFTTGTTTRAWTRL